MASAAEDRGESKQAGAGARRPPTEEEQADMKTWVTLYPAYIDSSLKITQGRKIAKEHACDRPHPGEMMEVLKRLKVPFYVENKKYPRQWWVPGRFRVKLKTDDGGFATDPQTGDEYRTRKILMRRVAELVPKVRAMMPKQAAPAAAAEGGGGKSGGGKKTGKKKKKGRR